MFVYRIFINCRNTCIDIQKRRDKQKDREREKRETQRVSQTETETEKGMQTVR